MCLLFVCSFPSFHWVEQECADVSRGLRQLLLTADRYGVTSIAVPLLLLHVHDTQHPLVLSAPLASSNSSHGTNSTNNSSSRSSKRGHNDASSAGAVNANAHVRAISISTVRRMEAVVRCVKAALSEIASTRGAERCLREVCNMCVCGCVLCLCVCVRVCDCVCMCLRVRLHVITYVHPCLHVHRCVCCCHWL